MKSALFSEFEAISAEAWRAVAERDLKGADFEKKLVHETLDGVRLQPIYTENDLPTTASPVRTKCGWLTREDVREPDAILARRHIEAAAQRGADEVSVRIYPHENVDVSARALGELSAGIDPTRVAIHWQAGPLTRPCLRGWKQALDARAIDSSNVLGSIECDPIMDRCAQWVDSPLGDWRQEFHDCVLAANESFCKATWLTIRGSLLEKAGASLAQELAWSIAIFHTYLSSLPPGINAQQLFEHTELRFGIGTNYVLEVCKLRAARVLLANLAALHGCNSKAKIHAVTTSSNKTIYDAHNNLLRATIESMAATVGGADSLTVAAYNQGYDIPDEFSEHLARNTTTLLASEAHLDKVADPLAGSYTAEALTRAYAEKAWTTFRQIESQGGFIRCFENGIIGSALEDVRAKREHQLASRKRTIIGITQFANPDESKLKEIGKGETMRQVSPVPSDESCWPSHWLTAKPVPSTPLDLYRPSWPFEHLRIRIERHVANGNRRPLIWLLMAGDLKMRTARATVCQSFFAAGGYALRQVVAEPLDAAVREANFERADVIVVCSADDQVLDFVRQVREVDGTTKLIVAGYPTDQIEALNKAGANDFVHIRTPQLEFLNQLHSELGVTELLQPEKS
jgi:methylmalonyl-CoA mutase